MERPVPYAGLVTRTLALAVDAVVINLALTLVTTVVGLAISVFSPGEEKVTTTAVLAVVGGWWVIASAYFASFWTLTGQTPGMRVLRLRVVSANGGRIGFFQALRRLVGMVAAAIPLMAGFAMILFDGRRQGLQDKIAGTLVLYVPEEEEARAPALLRPASVTPDPEPSPLREPPTAIRPASRPSP